MLQNRVYFVVQEQRGLVQMPFEMFDAAKQWAQNRYHHTFANIRDSYAERVTNRSDIAHTAAARECVVVVRFFEVTSNGSTRDTVLQEVSVAPDYKPLADIPPEPKPALSAREIERKFIGEEPMSDEHATFIKDRIESGLMIGGREGWLVGVRDGIEAALKVVRG